MADTASPPGTEDVFTFESAASKTFPLAPEGVHAVIVSKAVFSMRENTFKPEAGKQPTITLYLQSRQEYEETPGGAKRPYRLFKTFKISDHEKSSMYAFFQSVMGSAVPLNEKKQITLARKIEKRDDEEQVTLPQFENLEFSVVVKHEKSEKDGKMRDAVDSLFATIPQKTANAVLFRGAA